MWWGRAWALLSDRPGSGHHLLLSSAHDRCFSCVDRKRRHPTVWSREQRDCALRALGPAFRLQRALTEKGGSLLGAPRAAWAQGRGARGGSRVWLPCHWSSRFTGTACTGLGRRVAVQTQEQMKPMTPGLSQACEPQTVFSHDLDSRRATDQQPGHLCWSSSETQALWPPGIRSCLLTRSLAILLHVSCSDPSGVTVLRAHEPQPWSLKLPTPPHGDLCTWGPRCHWPGSSPGPVP